MVENNTWLKPAKLLDGNIMFPTTHDIFPEHLHSHIIPFLYKWLEVGNKILIVTKPRLECVERICEELRQFKDQITWRFTIGSMYDDILRFWEPNATNFLERFNSLKVANESGFATSVSCEPYLDSDVVPLVRMLLPYVSDTIWVGKMNQIEKRVNIKGWGEKEFKFLDLVKHSQTDQEVMKVVKELSNISQVRWKDTIKEVIGKYGGS
jgi:hypothetical protein